MVLVLPDLVPKGILMTAKMSYIDACLMRTNVRDFVNHCPSKYPHFRFYLGLFPLKYPKMVLVPPDLVPKGVLMTAKMSYIDACLMWMNVGYFLTQYQPNFFHFRIYLGLFPLKYPKNSVSTPEFGPKNGLMDAKTSYIDAWLMDTTVWDFLNSSSSKMFPFCNLFFTFSLKIP